VLAPGLRQLARGLKETYPTVSASSRAREDGIGFFSYTLALVFVACGMSVPCSPCAIVQKGSGRLRIATANAQAATTKRDASYADLLTDILRAERMRGVYGSAIGLNLAVSTLIRRSARPASTPPTTQASYGSPLSPPHSSVLSKRWSCGCPFFDLTREVQ
jgi:hypothetical protein